MADLVVAAQHVAHGAQAFGYDVKHARFGREHAFLWHVNDFQAALDDELPVVELLCACEDFEQRGFACAVAPDESDFFALRELEGGVV